MENLRKDGEDMKPEYEKLCTQLRAEYVRNGANYVQSAATAIEHLSAEFASARKDAACWRYISSKMRHMRGGPHVGWGLDELYPGDDPEDAILTAIARDQSP
jgi:hypothetical protein